MKRSFNMLVGLKAYSKCGLWKYSTCTWQL